MLPWNILAELLRRRGGRVPSFQENGGTSRVFHVEHSDSSAGCYTWNIRQLGRHLPGSPILESGRGHPLDFMIPGCYTWNIRHDTVSGSVTQLGKATHRPAFQASRLRVLHVEHSDDFRGVPRGTFWLRRSNCVADGQVGVGLRALFCTLVVFRDVPGGTCKPLSLWVFHVEHS